MAIYNFVRIIDSSLIVYHKSDAKFDKFDISKKSVSSSDQGIGYNFNISAPEKDIKARYTYKCRLNLNNPIYSNKRTISSDKWNSLIKSLGIEAPLKITSSGVSDVENYKMVSLVYSVNNSNYVDFLNKVKEVLGIDGVLEPEKDFAMCFDSDKIEILEIIDNEKEN